MKQQITTIIFFAAFMQLLVGCQTLPVSVTSTAPLAPAWYGKQQLLPEGFWVGYGDAPVLEQAKTLARADLSRSLSSRVSSHMQIQTGVGTDDEVQQQASSRIEEVSRASLSDLVTLKSEQVEGQYYVALGYDHRPLAERVLAMLESAAPASGVQAQPTPSQLMPESKLYEQLSASLGEAPVFSLYHENDRYLLGAGGRSVALRSNELALLFPKLDSPRIGIELSPASAVYPPEDLFTVKLTPQHAGYLSYLQVFGNGATVLMMSNAYTPEEGEWIYPDPNQYDGLMTELPAGKSVTRVLHLALLCPAKKDLSAFEAVSSQAGQDYQSYRLGEIPGLLQGCEASTLQQLIRR